LQYFRILVKYSMFENQSFTAQKVCVSCGKLFNLENAHQTYCPDCQYPTCESCGKKFRRVRGNVNRFCSRECVVNAGANKRSPITLACEYCGKRFKKKVGYNRKKYCSKKCRYVAARIEDEDRGRRSYKYKHWRQAVLIRDDYSCQHCGATKKLQAHHIKEWKDFPDLRYDVNNGLTLCTSCHTIAHGGVPTGRGSDGLFCTDCGKPITGKGESSYCRSCSLRHSPKAKASRMKRKRDKSGAFIPSTPA
jgi:hypothetical protein